MNDSVFLFSRREDRDTFRGELVLGSKLIRAMDFMIDFFVGENGKQNWKEVNFPTFGFENENFSNPSPVVKSNEIVIKNKTLKIFDTSRGSLFPTAI